MVVDDGSPDGTGADRRRARGASIPGRIEVMHRTGPRGPGPRPTSTACSAAIADGRRRSRSARWTPTSRTIPSTCRRWPRRAATHDVVIGSRYLHGVSVVNWPLHRIFLSTFANNYIRAVTRLTPRDCTSGFRCWRREALAQLPLGRHGLGRLRVPGRDALRGQRGAAAASARCRSSSSSAQQGQSKVSTPVSARIAGHPVAARAPPLALTRCRRSS